MAREAREVRITVRLPRGVVERITSLAREAGRSRSAFLQDFLDNFVEYITFFMNGWVLSERLHEDSRVLHLPREELVSVPLVLRDYHVFMIDECAKAMRQSRDVFLRILFHERAFMGVLEDFKEVYVKRTAYWREEFARSRKLQEAKAAARAMGFVLQEKA